MHVESLFPKRFMPLAIVVLIIGALAIVGVPILFGTPSYPIATGDRIASWNWQGPYKDGGQKEQETKAELAQLAAMLGKAGTSTYDLEVGIASEYELLGDGKDAYLFLSRAIKNDPSRGLAYFNMGHLMEELGAFQTARAAYHTAALKEPNNPVYTQAEQAFLSRHPS